MKEILPCVGSVFILVLILSNKADLFYFSTDYVFRFGIKIPRFTIINWLIVAQRNIKRRKRNTLAAIGRRRFLIRYAWRKYCGPTLKHLCNLGGGLFMIRVRISSLEYLTLCWRINMVYFSLKPPFKLQIGAWEFWDYSGYCIVRLLHPHEILDKNRRFKREFEFVYQSAS